MNFRKLLDRDSAHATKAPVRSDSIRNRVVMVAAADTVIARVINPPSATDIVVSNVDSLRACGSGVSAIR